MAVCNHEETIEEVPGSSLRLAQCVLCGQTRKYTDNDPIYSSVIVKLGRIDGKIVMPGEGVKIGDLSPEETRLVREGWDTINQRGEGKGHRRSRYEPHPKQRQPASAARAQKKTEEVLIPPAVITPSDKPERKEPTPRDKYWEDRRALEAAKKEERLTYFNQHRDEILADRLRIGHGRTMIKWRIGAITWAELKRKWVEQGIRVPDLRKATKKETAARIEAAGEVIVKESEKAEAQQGTEPAIEEATIEASPEIKGDEKLILTWKGMSKAHQAQWLKDHKEEITADILSMPMAKVLEKYSFGQTTFYKLAKIYALERTRLQREVAPRPTKSKLPFPFKSGDFSIKITEADLAKLDDEQFLQQWQLFGTIISNRKEYRNEKSVLSMF